MSKILKSLIEIQQNLNAPKDKFNSYGKFNYRSLEGIEEAIKPLLKAQSCGIYFSDEVVERCGRTFLRTTLTFFNSDGETITTTAEAEHAVQKPGMDQSQITGSASSYARKYAMNALFAIDDSKDADTDEFTNATQGGGIQMPQNQSQKRQRKSNTAIPVVPTTPVTPVIPSQKPDLKIKYSSVWDILKNLTTIDQMMACYAEHKNEVEGNAEIKELFGIRKKEITNNKIA